MVSTLQQRAPLDNVIPTTSSVPSCLEQSRYGLETSVVVAWPARRPILTAPARAGSRKMWVGAKKRAFKSNKETGTKKGKEENGDRGEIGA